MGGGVKAGRKAGEGVPHMGRAHGGFKATGHKGAADGAG